VEDRSLCERERIGGRTDRSFAKMLGTQPATKLMRRGSWIIRRNRDHDSETSGRKRDKEDEKLFQRLKRDNNLCADCSAKGTLGEPALST
jgi:hypothetical protein